MDIAMMIGIGIIGTAAAVLLKQYKPEFALMVSLVAGLAVFLIILSNVAPVVEEINALLQSFQISSQYIEILLKALGICFITQLACDACKDAGETAIAAKMEMGGKVAVLLVSLPLFKRIMEVITSLLNMR